MCLSDVLVMICLCFDAAFQRPLFLLSISHTYERCFSDAQFIFHIFFRSWNYIHFFMMNKLIIIIINQIWILEWKYVFFLFINTVLVPKILN